MMALIACQRAKKTFSTLQNIAVIGGSASKPSIIRLTVFPIKPVTIFENDLVWFWYDWFSKLAHLSLELKQI